MKQFLLAVIAIHITIQAFCQAGKPDASFSNDGMLTTLVGTSSTTGESVALQSNGKIIVAGFYHNGTHNNYDFTVVRYTTNGNLDNSFAGNGKAGIDFGGDDVGIATAIQSNGKIIVAGNSGPDFSNYKYVAIARLNTNGDLDPSFGYNGKLKLYSQMLVNAIAIQPDGKILIAGDSSNSVTTSFALLRLKSNGDIDSSFGNYGKVYTDFHGSDDEEKSVALQQDGKILAGGLTIRNGLYCFAIARYNTNGTLDASFGGDGKVTTPVGNSHSHGYGIAIQSNGKILQAGDYDNSAGYNQFAVIRYNTDGTLDNSFAGNGKAAVSFTGGSTANNVGIQSNGKIILTGTITNYKNYNFALARLNTDGTIDNSFGTNGKVVTDFGGNDYGVSSVIQPDNKIVIAGLTIMDKYRIAAARYIGFNNSSFTETDENDVSLSETNKQQAVLSQNFPNPFSNSTTISYSIPQQFSSAKIIITHKNGNVLKQINLPAGKQGLPGNRGLVNIDASTLLPGAYQYSLYVDGRLIDTKQMILSK